MVKKKHKKDTAWADEKATDLKKRYSDLEGVDLLKAMIKKEFPGRIALSSSFGAEAAVLLDLVLRIDPKVPIIFLDTGKLFEETYNYVTQLSNHIGLKDLRIIRPNKERLLEKDPSGNLWETEPDMCCHIRKVEPLEAALKGFKAWITGRKRYHGDIRLKLDSIESLDGYIKINPLINWDAKKIQTYFSEKKLPKHPLLSRGFKSIGCYHCTRETEDGEGVRSGRWFGGQKTECGIHEKSTKREYS